MIAITYDDIKVEVFIDGAFNRDSADSVNEYSTSMLIGDSSFVNIFCGIRLFKDNTLLNSCVIGGAGFGLFAEHSCLVKNNQLFICFTDSVFCLSLPDLQLQWCTKTDMVACFQIHVLENDIVTYGECEITRLDQDGSIIWQFSSEDIFIHENAFVLGEDKIYLTDFDGRRYILNFQGKIVE